MHKLVKIGQIKDPLADVCEEHKPLAQMNQQRRHIKTAKNRKDAPLDCTLTFKEKREIKGLRLKKIQGLID